MCVEGINSSIAKRSFTYPEDEVRLCLWRLIVYDEWFSSHNSLRNYVNNG